MTMQYLTFTLQNNMYAASVEYVQEVLEYTPPDQLPCTHDYIEGIIGSRGRGIQVVNLCKKFGLGPSPVTRNTRIIVLELKAQGQEGGMVLGAVADSVEEVIDIDFRALDKVLKFGNDINPEFIEGIAKKGDRFVILLDLARIFLEGDVD